MTYFNRLLVVKSFSLFFFFPLLFVSRLQEEEDTATCFRAEVVTIYLSVRVCYKHQEKAIMHPLWPLRNTSTRAPRARARSIIKRLCLLSRPPKAWLHGHFFCHSDLKHSRWQFQVNYLHEIWSGSNCCLHAPCDKCESSCLAVFYCRYSIPRWSQTLWIGHYCVAFSQAAHWAKMLTLTQQLIEDSTRRWAQCLFAVFLHLAQLKSSSGLLKDHTTPTNPVEISTGSGGFVSEEFIQRDSDYICPCKSGSWEDILSQHSKNQLGLSATWLMLDRSQHCC